MTLTVTEFARKGGLARGRKLSKKRRKEIATVASMAALDKRRKQTSHTYKWITLLARCGTYDSMVAGGASVPAECGGT
jgi:hypothetical protein